MATTTNYGWTTPDDTALVKDGASAIRSLGTSVDTTTKNLNPSTTLGDIEYRSSTANTNTRLAIGSTGNVLTVVGGVPAWAAPAGGGKVLQVVQGTYSTLTTVASTSYTDTGLSATITPSSSSSKVLILVNQIYQSIRSNNQSTAAARILRGSTVVFQPGDRSIGNNYINGASSASIGGVYAFTYLDSPSTTSATTYKTQGAAGDTSSDGMVRFQLESSTSVMTLIEIGA